MPCELTELQSYVASDELLSVAGEHPLPFKIAKAAGMFTTVDVVQLDKNAYTKQFAPGESEVTALWVQLEGVSWLRAGNLYQRSHPQPVALPGEIVQFPSSLKRRSIENPADEICMGALLRVWK